MIGGWAVGFFAATLLAAMWFGVRWEVKREFANRRKMLAMSSWDGSGKDVYCDMCGDHLDMETIRGMDEDGHAYCAKHTRRTGGKP
jgi:hypothetical protein